jgi:hypothetical protein
MIEFIFLMIVMLLRLTFRKQIVIMIEFMFLMIVLLIKIDI